MKFPPHEVVITTTHSMTYLDLRHDFFRVAAFIAMNALLVNFLPPARSIQLFFLNRGWAGPERMQSFCWWYSWVIDLMSFFALNLRSHLPSLDLPWFYNFDPQNPPKHAWKHGEKKR